MTANPNETVVTTTPAATPGSTPAAGKSWDQTWMATKYGNDPAKAEKGIVELNNYAAQVQKQNAELTERSAKLESALAALTGATPANPGANLPASQRFANEVAADPALFKQAIGEVLAEVLAPAAQAFGAREAYAKEDPTYVERATEVDAFRAANPEIQASFHRMEQADPKAALEWLDAKYVQHEVATKGAAPAAGAAAARVQSSMPSNMQPARAPAPAVEQDIAAKEKYFNETGDKTAYVAAVLDQTAGKQMFLQQVRRALGHTE